MNETILTVIATGVSVVGLIYTFLRNFKADIHLRLDGMDKRLDGMDKRLDGMDKRLDGMTNELKEINTKLNDLDKRLYAVETVLHMKDCCVLKQDQNLKKAE